LEIKLEEAENKTIEALNEAANLDVSKKRKTSKISVIHSKGSRGSSARGSQMLSNNSHRS
jgi:hypothetical protein